MARMRALRIGLLVVLALAVSGCGGKKQASGSVPPGAEFAPASAPAYIAIATDPNGAQWKAANRLLQRFPGRGKLLETASKELTKQGLAWDTDVKPALPAHVHVVWLDFANNGSDVVGYAKPKDDATFTKLLESGTNKLVHRQIDGWTVFSSTAGLIDKFESARASGDSLTDVKAFTDAIAEQPADAAVRGWLSGEAIQAEIDREASANPGARSYREFTKSFGQLESVSFAAAAADQGVKVEAAYKARGGPKTGSFSSKLDDKLPAGALLYLSFGNLDDFFNEALASAERSVPDFKTRLAQIEQAMGFSLKKDLLPLFSREGAVALYHASELTPGVTFMLDVKGDEDKARNVVTRLGALLQVSGQGRTTKLTVNGVEVSHLSYEGQPFELFVAVSDGVLIADSTEAGIRGLLGDTTKLVDDPVYKQAREASGAPDDTVGFFYANLERGLPYVFDLMELSSGARSSVALANIKPLRSTFFYAKRDGDRTTVSGFLTIK
jgi:hypothetical protein